VGDPSLGDNAVYVCSLSLGVLWFSAWLNIRGLSLGKLFTNGGALAAWLAALLLIVAGAVALARFGSATSWTGQVLGASVGGFQALAYFGTLSFALVGLELAPIMGGEIHDPKRTVPRAVMVSAVAIGILYVAGTLAIMVALRPEEVSPVSGALGAVQAVADHVGVPVMGAVTAALISFGVVGGVAAWLGAAARLPLVVGLDKFLPPVMAQLHPVHRTPHMAILVQTVLCSIFIVASQAGSKVHEAYIVLLDTTIVLNFIPFLYLFVALPRLRPDGAEPGVVRVPGGRGGLWLVACAGLLTTLLTLLSAVIPPPDVNTREFVVKQWGGLLVFGAVGYIIYRQYRRRSWKPQ